MKHTYKLMYFLILKLLGCNELFATAPEPFLGSIHRASHNSILFSKTHADLSYEEIARIFDIMCEVGFEPTDANNISPVLLRSVSFDQYSDSIYTISPLVVKVMRNNYSNVVYSNHLMAHATKVGDLCAMTILFKHDVRVDYADAAGNTPLHYAAMWNQAAAARWLLAQGAPLDAPNKKERTPLYLACQTSHNSYLKRLGKMPTDFSLLSEKSLDQLSSTALALLDANANVNLVPPVFIVRNTRYFYHPHVVRTLAPIPCPREGSLAYPHDRTDTLYESITFEGGDRE